MSCALGTALRGGGLGVARPPLYALSLFAQRKLMWYGVVVKPTPVTNRSFPMTTIPQLAQAMQTILTDQADRAGRQTGMVQRSDAKLTGSVFTQTLVFGLGADPHSS